MLHLSSKPSIHVEGRHQPQVQTRVHIHADGRPIDRQKCEKAGDWWMRDRKLINKGRKEAVHAAVIMTNLDNEESHWGD